MSTEEKESRNVRPDELLQNKTLVGLNSFNDQTPCWLSAELRVNDFSIKHQSFTITGWINVCWIWRKVPKTLANWEGGEIEDESLKTSKMIFYETEEAHDPIIKIVDLRDSDITYYLPINAKKIFFQPSLQDIQHIDPPCLYYNKKTQLTRTQYYIHASLLEHLELFFFPFDRQFLNVKLYDGIVITIEYWILIFEQEKKIPIDEKCGEKTIKELGIDLWNYI
eukprot:821666_1